MRRADKAAIAGWVLVLITQLAFAVAVLIVAIHFIKKWW